MAFNLGIAGLQRFTKFLAALEQKDYETAATEMLDSVWAEQVGRRAQRLAAQMRSGAWQ
jgi:lysozyme